MFKLSAIVLLVFSVYYSECIPAQASISKTTAVTGQKLHLYVNNGTEGINYHLSPVVNELQEEDEYIDTEIAAILPLLNFAFDPDKGSSNLDNCFDQLEVQLVHED